ncbi:hypothetical protein SKAU_G00049800 [Synaphobranchus kaupii]|uniref:Uncharacterized protein n=1 Tax=Synaphobranchus kaupii TaxID=118154 RepID=A0A9Q1J9M9_SYNKA|nr:hypothetical protein SKAU_G00049800 [Synaphobranchus kaupii]
MRRRPPDPKRMRASHGTDPAMFYRPDRKHVQSTKKKKEGTTSPRQVSKKAPKERARPTPNQHSSDDENPWDWITLNRCLLLSVVVIVVSTGVNSLNETVGVFWEVEDAELTAEELALRHGDVQQGNAPEESSLWDSLFWWSRRSRDGCDDDDDDCDDYDAVDDDYTVYDDDDDDAIDGDDDDDDDDDAVDGDDDGDDDDDDGDDGPGGKSRKVQAGKRGVHRESGREEDTEKPGKGLSGEPEEDTPKGKREKGRLTRQKHGGEEEEEEEEEEERPRRKRQRGAREQRQG